MKNFDSFPFVVDKHNRVWKYVKAKGHFIKVTPWNNGEDRRVNRFQIEKLIKENKLTQMKDKPAVHEIINKVWDNCYRSWEYMGVEYRVDDREHAAHYEKAPIHKFEHFYTASNGEKCSWYENWRLGFNNGKIVWVNAYHYYPRVIIAPFESIDKEPKGNFSWTTYFHVRPIYSTATGEYI